MMHKLFRVTLLLALVAGGYTAHAQSKANNLKRHPQIKKINPSALKAVPMPKALTGFEDFSTNPADAIVPSVPQSKSMLRANLTEEKVGTTTYDLQTNGVENPRIVPLGGQEGIGAAWTMSLQPEGAGWSDRGTGYNTQKNWNEVIPVYPLNRAESVRTGFTNYVATASGTEIIISHQGSGVLNLLRRPAGQANWDESTIPSNVACLWAHAATDGEYLYVLALSIPVSSGGTIYEGMDGHVLMWRSPDGGSTWDITDGIIPGLDSTSYAAIGPDNYSVDARDGVVAVGVFDSWNDVTLYKSFDGGDTWEDPVVVFDFPLFKYVTDQGYTVDDLPVDDTAPDTLAIFTTDGSASMLIDNTGFVHMWMGETYVLDSPFDDGGSFYYPGINGLIYWSELDPETLYEITGSLDFDGNDTLDITTVVGYGTGLSSMPAAASDENGGIYVVYSATVERLEDDAGNNYRHLYMMKSPDYGQTWFFPPVDLNYATDTDPDSNLAKISEGVYPSVYKRVSDKLHILYQRDLTPGAAVLKTGTQADESADLVYIGNADAVGINNVAVNNLELSLNPNPVSQGLAQLSFNLDQGGETQVFITDVRGGLVRTVQQGTLSAGPNYVQINTANLQDGVYFVRVQSGNLNGTKKLVVINK
ncbi:MAG: T9SS type A sorting domain-containing protein [Saprospiraceae bacterium]